MTGLTFTPKVVLFWGTNQTATGIADDQTPWFGAATSSTQRWACAMFSDDNVATTDVAHVGDAGQCILCLSSSTTKSVVADFVSMDTTGFTVNFSTVTTNTIIHYLAIGGSDITNVKAGTFTLAVATGNQDFTDPAFTPDCVLFASNGYRSSTWAGTILNTNSAGSSLAAGLSTSARWCTYLSATDAQTMTANINAMNTQRTDNIIITLNDSAALDSLGDYSGGIANGFRINISDAPLFTHTLGYVAFQGGSYAVGALTASTSVNGTNDVNVGFVPEAILFSTWSLASSTTISADAQGNVGAATYDGSEGWAGSTYEDVVLNTQTDSVTGTTKAIGSLIEGATATLDSEADSDLTGVGGANTFRLTWTDPPAVAAEVCYIAFGPHTSAFTTEYVAPIHEQRAGGVMIGRRYV